jgi:hypothetical protein
MNAFKMRKYRRALFRVTGMNNPHQTTSGEISPVVWIMLGLLFIIRLIY